MLFPRTNPSRQGWQIAAGLLFAALAGLPALSAQPRPGQPVSLYLTVEQNGNLVRGLGPRNFRLYQDGEPQQFHLETPQTPISVALLVEDSQSSYYYFYDDIQAAVQGFLDAAPAGNWYSLATFDHSLHIDVDFTRRIGEIPDAFAGLGEPLWNENDSYDAIYEMLEKMGRLPGRKVLIFVGTGLDSFSGHTLDDVEKKIESVDVTVYAVAAGSALRGYYEPYVGQMQRMNFLQAQAFLEMLAAKSGGQAWFPEEQGAYPDVMKGIFQSLQNQYRLVYTPQAAADGKFHRLKLEAFTIQDDKRHDYKVRVREGWRF